MVGGDSVVHLSGLYLLARALATGDATVILQAFQHKKNKRFTSEPPANKLRASIKNRLSTESEKDLTVKCGAPRRTLPP